MLRILINLPIERLVRTGPDRSLTSPGILEMAKDHRPDCGCGPVRSCDFQSWLVRVQSSPGLFPVLGPDFQTLVPLLTEDEAIFLTTTYNFFLREHKTSLANSFLTILHLPFPHSLELKAVKTRILDTIEPCLTEGRFDDYKII